jgi:ketosteroid isomerase-like protein
VVYLAEPLDSDAGRVSDGSIPTTRRSPKVRSSEVESFVAEMYERMRAGDGDGAAEMVADDGVLFVGTDTEEWWETTETVRAAFREQLEATGGFDISAGDVVAFADGDVGWFGDRPTMGMPDGSSMTMRMTGVVRKAGDRWVCVQGHLSVPADVNETLFE